MDEIEELKRLRGEQPSDAQSDRMRATVTRAMSGVGRETPGRSRLPVGVIAGVLVGVMVSVAAWNLLSSEKEPGANPVTAEQSLSALSQDLQRYTQSDYDPLGALGTTLADVAAESTVVGSGRLVDIRLTFEEPDGLQHMALVIEPERMTAGADALGSSGEVLVDEIAPPIDRETGSRGLEEMRAVATGPHSHVAFMLTPTPLSTLNGSPDKVAGRAEDDPLYWPTHPSSLLALEDKTGLAFPLLTDEQIENSKANLDALDEAGANVEEFGRANDSLGGSVP